MLRIIVRTDNAGMAANVGGSVYTFFKTFLVSAPQVEFYLRQRPGDYGHRQVVGVEIVEDEGATQAEPDADGWIPWPGGKCPVTSGTYGKAKFRDGFIGDCGDLSRWRWSDTGSDNDIVAYQVQP